MWSPSQAIARRAAKRKPAFYTSINLAGFVSVQAVLIVQFIVYATPNQYPWWRAAYLPDLQNATLQPGALREDLMDIIVARDGQIYFRNERTNPQELPALIQTALREGSEKTIYLAADQRTCYRDVKIALDEVRLAGIRNVVLMTGRPTEYAIQR